MACGWGSKSASHGHCTRPGRGRNAGYTVSAMPNVCYKVKREIKFHSTSVVITSCSLGDIGCRRKKTGESKTIYFIRKIRKGKKLSEHEICTTDAYVRKTTFSSRIWLGWLLKYVHLYCNTTTS